MLQRLFELQNVNCNLTCCPENYELKRNNVHVVQMWTKLMKVVNAELCNISKT